MVVCDQKLKILAGFSSLPLCVTLVLSIAIKPAATEPAELASNARQQIESILIVQDEYKPPVTGTPTNDGGSGSRT